MKHASAGARIGGKQDLLRPIAYEPRGLRSGAFGPGGEHTRVHDAFDPTPLHVDSRWSPGVREARPWISWKSAITLYTGRRAT